MNCLFYARVSTDKQAQKDLLIPAQIEAMRDYAKKNSWKVIDNFVDEGDSAKTANRPELNGLIRYCKENKEVDIILVHKIEIIRISFLGSSLIQLKFMQIPALDIYGWIYNTKNSKVKG